MRIEFLPVIAGSTGCRRALTALVVIVLVTAPPLVAQQEVLRNAATKIADSLTRSGKKSVAVVDFTDLQGNVTELGRFLAEQLSVSLAVESKGLDVIDRTHLKTLLQEHKLSTTGLIDPQTARKLGQIAGVDALATGNLTPLGDSVNLSLKVLDTNTARMLTAALIDIPKTKAIEELLAREIGAPAAARATPAYASRTSGLTSTTKTTSARSSAAVGSLQLGDILVEIKSCRKIGTKATCSAVITNRSAKMMPFWFLDPWNHSRTIVDDTGFQSTGLGAIRVKVSSGNDVGRLDLEPDLPIRLTLDGMEVSAEATHINIMVASRIGDYRNDSTTLSLRNLPLE